LFRERVTLERVLQLLMLLRINGLVQMRVLLLLASRLTLDERGGGLLLLLLRLLLL